MTTSANDTARLRMAVIGVGHLGKQHARILSGLPEVELVGVADVNLAQAQTVAQRCRTRAADSYHSYLTDVDAVSVVVPTSQHWEVAAAFLRRGTPVFVEKPLADNVARAEQLVELSRQHQTILQVGHIERFNPAFEDLLRRPLQPKFIRCARLGPFSGRSTDIGVVFDLMIHDLDLVLALVRSPVVAVDALGVSVFGDLEDIANARLTFANGCVADLCASRSHQTMVRQMQVWAPEGYAGIDFARRQLTLIQPSESLRQRGLDFSRLTPPPGLLKETLFDQDLPTLVLNYTANVDQLTAELSHFVHCVRTRTRPRVSGDEGWNAVAIAERIVEAIRHHAWDGRSNTFIGPSHLPSPLGALFSTGETKAAA